MKTKAKIAFWLLVTIILVGACREEPVAPVKPGDTITLDKKVYQQ